ncbi:hypothetical protein GGP41_006782 [Bipolaris sorokiniana]|uniref:Uncharacterized protein n=2 Tax=Cochliobolus sativus TaxID=45130 RepID=A0A8H5ZRQ7_COCSA|nr:uncharacterized protein COCSADRAFT_26518 [Bipolaris sorokiniana ND90Pr]EMD64362.1 hypothetical protein COCSADRAFT_26518 [Bipolaris sorokiniana ND90Pr]KAF5854005.1 hypothetical protein GGP41_006782 [Bipolaris sorokiniana]
MNIPGYDALVYYTTQPNNYIGTTLFLSYIVAALYATFAIIYSLYSQYATIFGGPASKKDEKLDAARTARARHIKIYAFLASLSFATLSYNMLMFLITHFLEWNAKNSPSPSAITIEQLKRWMLESTLFQDFAQDLVKNAPNASWTEAAILATWFWNIYMAQKARERKYDASMVRKYTLLSQILPISFTVLLFIIQLHLSSPDISPTETSKEPAKPKSVPRRRSPIASLQIPNILLNASLLALPALRSNSIFMVLLLLTRAILLLPHSAIMSLRDADVVKCITVSGGFAVASVATMRKDLSYGGVLGSLGDGGYAIKALAWDALFGLIAYAVLGWGGGV